MSFAASESNILRRFVLVNDSSMTWLDAQAYCRKKHTDLARVRNQQENTVLQTMLTENAVWFGLGLQSWVWSDGTQPSFQPWSYHRYPEDNGDCGAFDFGRRFHELIKINCDKNVSFFCYSGKHIGLLFHFCIC